MPWSVIGPAIPLGTRWIRLTGLIRRYAQGEVQPLDCGPKRRQHHLCDVQQFVRHVQIYCLPFDKQQWLYIRKIHQTRRYYLCLECYIHLSRGSCLPKLSVLHTASANIDLRTLTHGLVQFENKNSPWLRDCCSNNNPSIWVVIKSLDISSMPTQSAQGKHDFSGTWTWLRATPSILTLGSPLPGVLRLISLSCKRF